MDVSRLLTSTVSVERFTGNNGYNKPTFAAPVTLPARVEWTKGRGEGPGGEAYTVTAEVLTSEAIGPRDRVTLPGETQPRTPENIATEQDTRGTVIAYRTSL